MSQTDSFIEEVTEEVRRDKLFALIKRYGWVAALAVLLIVGGASWREWSQARDRAAAQALGDAILAALEQPDAADRATALADLASAGDARALAALLAAGETDEGARSEAAAEVLRGIAEDPTLPVHYTQLAALKLVMLEGRAIAPEARRDRLAPLAEPGRPYRPLALEQLALAEVDAGNTEAALGHLNAAIQDAGSSAGLRQRATQLIVALGGDAEQG
ncbi:hypothetical protein [Rhodovulum adriaticum]|uniref:Tetratricopeptide repeat-like domain-containing protein n=1 Tax=Rhodovulum adriaticum TaxID=35804 RepID=A0A4R2NVT4_RHOAD|nr:hypothetical protein [Rhodovulum adriaticum]MBK1636205.1 hypothetical protein [Rhodovulum adriaticum]TCP25525.1 hypothetical protein EV656_103278 [Rhodovulum adriaticum]